MLLRLITSCILWWAALLPPPATGSPARSDSTSALVSVRCAQAKGTVVTLDQPSALTGHSKRLAASSVNSAGQALLQLRVDQFEFATLALDQQLVPLFIVPGAELGVTLEGQADSLQIHFVGPHAKASEFLYRSALLLARHQELADGRFVGLPQRDFFEHVQQLGEQYADLLESYRTNTYLDQAIVLLLGQRNQMQLAGLTYQYAQATFDFTRLSVFQDSVLTQLRVAVPQPFFLLGAKAVEYQIALNAYLQLVVVSPIQGQYAKADTAQLRHLPTLYDEQLMRGLYPAPVRVYLRAKNLITQAQATGLTEAIAELYRSLTTDTHYRLYEVEVADFYNQLARVKPGHPTRTAR